MWDLARRQKLRAIEWPGSAIEALALSPDGKLIAAAGRDKNKHIRLWEAATGKAVRVLKGHKEDVTALAKLRHRGLRRLGTLLSDHCLLEFRR